MSLVHRCYLVMLGFDPASQPKNQSMQRKSDCCVKRYWTEIALRGSSNRVRARDDRFFAKTTAFFIETKSEFEIFIWLLFFINSNFSFFSSFPQIDSFVFFLTNFILNTIKLIYRLNGILFANLKIISLIRVNKK